MGAEDHPWPISCWGPFKEMAYESALYVMEGSDIVKPIRLTRHAQEQCDERGASKYEVMHAIRNGSREPAKGDRILCRYNFVFEQTWHGKRYPIKQVAPVIKETTTETIVITVYTFFF